MTRLIASSVKEYNRFVDDRERAFSDKVIFETVVEIAPLRRSRIVIHELDDLAEVAATFCARNGLGQLHQNKLLTSLRECVGE